MSKEKIIKSINEKLSISIENLEKEFNDFLKEAKESFVNLSDEEYEKRALQRLALFYKAFLKSPAVGFDGIVIGMSDVVDMVARKRNNALTEYVLDPESAIMKGLVNDKGEPIDNLQTYSTGKPNPNFGKPLPENSFQRTIIGIATKTKIENDKPKMFIMNIRGKKANELNIPLFTPLSFSAIDRTPDEMKKDRYVLNASNLTNFEKNENLKFPPIMEILQKICKDVMVEMKDLEKYHKDNAEDFNRIVITTGGVSSMGLEETTFGSRILNLEDVDNLENFDDKGVTCWIPKHIKIDFAEGSKIVVVGRTNQGKRKDEDGNLTEEPGDLTINVFGIYAIPEYKIPTPEDVQEINENVHV